MSLQSDMGGLAPQSDRGRAGSTEGQGGMSPQSDMGGGTGSTE